MDMSLAQGLLYFLACLPIGIVGLISAIHQGKTAVASIGIVAKKPEQFGKAMLFPAMVETYAILALLVSILAVSALYCNRVNKNTQFGRTWRERQYDGTGKNNEPDP